MVVVLSAVRLFVHERVIGDQQPHQVNGLLVERFRHLPEIPRRYVFECGFGGFRRANAGFRIRVVGDDSVVDGVDILGGDVSDLFIHLHGER